VVTHERRITVNNDLDIAAASQSIAADEVHNVATTTYFDANNDSATPKQDRIDDCVDRQNRHL
jgi:hypothetical protein